MKYTVQGMKQSTASISPSHREIITRGGGPAAIGHKIGVSPNTTKAWSRLDSIPAHHWQALANAGVATLDELASAAAEKISFAPKGEAA